MTHGVLIAFEGLDQSGKATQTRKLREHLEAAGHHVETLAFPDYATPIGAEIGRALRGEHDLGPDVIQLLQIANRHQWKPSIEAWLEEGRFVLCDRYAASSVAYGEAQGLDPDWLTAVQVKLPQPAITVLLDIGPETAARRKARNRDLFEQDLAMLGRVRESYLRLAERGGWIVVDAGRPADEVAAEVAGKVEEKIPR